MPELAEREAAKKARHADRIQEGTAAGWRLINPSQECFKLNELAPNDAFIEFKSRGRKSLSKIFKMFVSDELLQKALDNISPNGRGIIVGTRKPRPGKATLSGKQKVLSSVRYAKHMIPTIAKLKQKLAYEIRIIGMQKVPTETSPGSNSLANAIKEAMDHFKSLDPISGRYLSRDAFKALNSKFVWTGDLVEELNKAIQAEVLRLGQCVAGDEKLFHFTGDGENVRLVISKPGKVGHWFYQLCAKSKFGNVFCLYIKLHDNSTGEAITVDKIVGDWNSIIRRIGESLIVGERVNDKTYLVHDSYYFAADSKKILFDSNTNFMSSCKQDRVKTEYATLEDLWKKLPANITKELADLPVDKYAAMYNPNTGDCFIVHHDRQKGVGIKINYSHGMIRSTRKADIDQLKNHIPCYFFYKFAFDACDRFNRNLHDKSWPHARGGHGTKGDFLNQHDFVMAMLLQNVFALFDELNETYDHSEVDWKFDGKDIVNPARTKTFCDRCLLLADELFLDSLNLNPTEIFL